MVAVIGTPGSVHHKYRYCASRKEAEEWLERKLRATLDANPVVGTLPTRVLSNREAARVR